MNEAAVTADLMKFLRAKREGVILKLADKATIGIPDLVITAFHHSFFAEIKVVHYAKKKLLSLREIVGYQGAQYRNVVLMDYHGAAAYVIFFHSKETREWLTMVTPGVRMANYCNQDWTVALDRPAVYDLKPGKNFEAVWEWVLTRRKDIDKL